MKTVEKWVAGFWMDELIVVKAKFFETKTRYGLVREDSHEYRQACSALNDIIFVLKSQNRLHDTPEDALDRLHGIQVKFMQAHRRKIEEIQSRLSIIDDFELTPD